MYNYAVRFEKDTAPGLAVYCRDLPQFSSYGNDEQHAMTQAVDGVESTLSIYVDEYRAIPTATPPEDGEHIVHLPAATVLKIALWNAIIELGMGKGDLSHALGVSQIQGARLVNFLHESNVGEVEAALAVLSKRLAAVQEVG